MCCLSSLLNYWSLTVLYQKDTQMLQGGFLSFSLSHHDSSAAADELGCRDSVCSQGGPQETQTWRAGLPERRLPHYCWHQHGTVMCKRSVCCQSLFSSVLTQAPDRCFFFSQKKGYYKARHNATGEEGLINSTKLREREALRVDPSLSLMPYVSSSSKFDALSLVRRITSVHMFTFSVTVTWKLFLTLAVGQSHLVTTQCWLVWDVQTNIVSGLITPTSLFLFCVCVNDRVLDDVFSCCLLKNLSL